MSMTKQDYELIARALRNKYDHYEGSTHWTNGWRASVKETAYELSVQFEQDNPRFDRAKFLEACLGKASWNGIEIETVSDKSAA